MNFTLHIWRQKNAESLGNFVTYQVDNIDGRYFVSRDA